jgi:hypothetical protein
VSGLSTKLTLKNGHLRSCSFHITRSRFQDTVRAQWLLSGLAPVPNVRQEFQNTPITNRFSTVVQLNFTPTDPDRVWPRPHQPILFTLSNNGSTPLNRTCRIICKKPAHGQKCNYYCVPNRLKTWRRPRRARSRTHHDFLNEDLWLLFSPRCASNVSNDPVASEPFGFMQKMHAESRLYSGTRTTMVAPGHLARGLISACRQTESDKLKLNMRWSRFVSFRLELSRLGRIKIFLQRNLPLF